MADKADVTGKSVQERLLDDLSSGRPGAARAVRAPAARALPGFAADGVPAARVVPAAGAMEVSPPHAASAATLSAKKLEWLSAESLDGQSPQKGAKRSSSGGRVRPAGKDLSALDGLVGARGAGAPSYPAASTLADPSARHFAGLSNQGATCYMNSLLQTLFMTPDFRDLMFRWRYSRAVDGPPDMCVPLQLQKLFAVLQSTRRRAIETKALTHSFGWSGSQAFEQHDVQELARVLLDALDETVHAGQQAAGAKADGAVAAATADEPATAAGGPGPAAAAGPGGLRAPSSIFGGQLEEYVRCDECGNTRRRFADFQDLSLDVVPFGAERGFASIGESLASYCAPEVMDGSNKVQCDVCGRQTRTVKGSRVSKWPQYLVLQLKRFTIDMLSPTLQRVKLQDPSGSAARASSADAEASGGKGPASRKAPPPPPRNHTFELFAVLVHSGGALGGHYYAYVKDLESCRWFNFNDSSVSPIDE
ncbi:usp47, partial [Symbiodinium sp. KB8]